jgi:hypothetical protein
MVPDGLSAMLKLKFVDFWPGFVVEDNILWKVLRANFEVTLSDEPDYLVYSVFGGEHIFNQRYERCIKILWTAESVRPNFKICDYALSFDYLADPRHLRWPLYALTAPPLVNPIDVDAAMTKKTKFCNFLYSNPCCQVRNDFFHLLSTYKRVDSGGLVLNNIGRRVGAGHTDQGYSVDDKRIFQSEYKFTIAFENSSHPGYVTEKIVDPLLAGSVPIYWGSERIAEEFNHGCFINAHEYPSMSEVVRRVVEVDCDDDLYRLYLSGPRFSGGKLPACCEPDYLVPFFQKIFADREPRCHSKPNLLDVLTTCGWSVLS